MKLKKALISVFFPERCSICGGIKPFLKDYCSICKVETKPISPLACQKCGHEKCICELCVTAELQHITAVYSYEGQVKRSILRFKFHSESSYAELFGKAMAERVRLVYPDISFDGICFIPMRKQDEIIRGYNQSELLARTISKELGIPLLSYLKKDASFVQKQLSYKERFESVKGNFSLTQKSQPEGKTILLCDDIKTTGATLKECSNVLLTNGAKDVYCICIAATPYADLSNIF